LTVGRIKEEMIYEYDFNSDGWDLVKASTIVNWRRGKKSEIVTILLKAMIATFEEITNNEFEKIFNKHFKNQINIANDV